MSHLVKVVAAPVLASFRYDRSTSNNTMRMKICVSMFDLAERKNTHFYGARSVATDASLSGLRKTTNCRSVLPRATRLRESEHRMIRRPCGLLSRLDEKS